MISAIIMVFTVAETYLGHYLGNESETPLCHTEFKTDVCQRDDCSPVQSPTLLEFGVPQSRQQGFDVLMSLSSFLLTFGMRVPEKTDQLIVLTRIYRTS